ncbi:MAG: hypothetical protein Kow0065_17640 [Methylomicrobium sp.]
MYRLVLSIALLAGLAGCSHVDPNPMREYLTLAPAQKKAEHSPKVTRFVELYDNLDTVSVRPAVEKTYAEYLYFNDTLVTLHDREALIRYMQGTQQSVDDIGVDILSVIEQGDDVFVRWSMRTRFTVLGQDKEVTTIGFSHLRFDDRGLIVLHQDYWDSAQGLFLHIPIIGGFLQWLKNGLHD